MSKVAVDIATLVEIQFIADKLLRQPTDVIGLAARLHHLLLPFQKECLLHQQSTCSLRNIDVSAHEPLLHPSRPRHFSFKHSSQRHFDPTQSTLFSTTTTATGLPKEEPGPVKTKRLPKIPKDKSPLSTPIDPCNGDLSCECFGFKNRGRRRTFPNLPQTQKFSLSTTNGSGLHKKYLSASTDYVNGDFSSDDLLSYSSRSQSFTDNRDIPPSCPHLRFEPCQISIVASDHERCADATETNHSSAPVDPDPGANTWEMADPEEGTRWFSDYQEDLLDTVGEWNFQIFELADKTDSVLSQMAYKLFQSTGLFETFRIPKREFVCFMQALESGYKAIPYHNKIHAADVLHGCWFLTTQEVPCFHYHFPQCTSDSSDSDSGTSSINTPQVTDFQHGSLAQAIPALELMALYLAAAMHDYDHPGKTNAFLVETRHPLANTYNDRSVLENHHASASWELLYSNKNFDFLQNLDAAEWKRLRFLIVEAILATDLKKHFNILKQFTAKTQLSSSSSSSSIEDEIEKNPEKSGLNWSDDEHRLLVCQMVIKLADISGPAKARPLHITWTKAICQEFFLQGDVESGLGMPVSPFMNKEKPQVAELQRTFINNLITPVLRSMHNNGILAGEVAVDDDFYSSEKLPREQNLLIEHLKSNLRFWKSTPWKSGHEEMRESFKYALPHRLGHANLSRDANRRSALLSSSSSSRKLTNGIGGREEDDVFDRNSLETLSNGIDGTKSSPRLSNSSERSLRSRIYIKQKSVNGEKDAGYKRADSACRTRPLDKPIASR